MKLYTVGEKYINLASLVRIFFECFVILALIAVACNSLYKHEYLQAFVSMILASICLTLTIVEAAMDIKQ